MRGTMLTCAGTHPLSDWWDAKMVPIQRFAEFVEQISGWPAGSRPLVFTSMWAS
jgi:gamma-glutamyl:cysteine ligase YbdK (ATP-grasp superfamily)